MAELPLYPISRDHLDALTGELGIRQHGTGPLPNPRLGYCTDDVARALVVDLLHARGLGWQAVQLSAWRSLRFLRDACSPSTRRFRNLRDPDGRWLDERGSEDSQGRALLALGIALREHPDPKFTAGARFVFGIALPGAQRLNGLRAIASAILACAAAQDSGALEPKLQVEADDTLLQLTSKLYSAFTVAGSTAEWPWPEPVLSYENALLPHALLVGGQRLGGAAAERVALRALDWLTEVQTSPGGAFSPVGNSQWWRQDGPRSTFDQQPIEATAMLLASEAAYAQTSDTRYLDTAERAYGWFLGANDVGVPVADPATGACHDGLGAGGANTSQGAESTLMWLIALEHVRAMRHRAGTGRRRPATRGIAAEAVSVKPS